MQPAQLELRAPLVRRDLPAPLGQPGRKALRELLARREGFLAGRNPTNDDHTSCVYFPLTGICEVPVLPVWSS